MHRPAKTHKLRKSLKYEVSKKGKKDTFEIQMRYILFFIPMLLAQSIFGQSKLPVIKATSKKVAIDDGGFLDKNAWALSPKIRPDIFTADRTRNTKWVTFYTDIDSIRVKVKPGTRFDFIVLLNGKDSCYTRIVSAIPPKSSLKDKVDKNDTIPFTLTSFNAIHVRSVINNTDTLNLHFDIGSFDFHLTKDCLAKLKKVFKLQMGTLVWNDPAFMPTGLTAHGMDGRFGWNLFEGKRVEIDYDHHLLIIRSRLPKDLRGYVRSKIDFIRSFVCVKGTFEIENKSYPADFILDTGSDQAIIIDSFWAGRQGFPKDLKLIRSAVVRDPRGVTYENKIVLSPLMRLNHFVLTNIPTFVLGNKNPVGFEVNYLGNDLLKRFNIILDFSKDYLYLKPNELMSVPYREES